MALAVVRDLSGARAPASVEDLADFETDVLSGLVLARSSAGLTDGTVGKEIGQLEQIRMWFGRPLWEMGPSDADDYFGRVLRNSPSGTRLARSQALEVYFAFVELRYQAELHRLTGRVVSCPLDEMNRPRGRKDAKLRIPPNERQISAMFAGWAAELATCRKFAPTARNYAAARLMAEVGLRVNELRHLDLADVKWDLGRFGKLHVRLGKGARGSGPRERMVPLINDAGRTLRWYVEDVWGQFGDEHTRPGAPLFPSERKTRDGSCARVGDDALRAGLAQAAGAFLPDWPEPVTPHVLRHFCASQLYLHGMDLLAIQEALGHAWIATTLKYVHVHRSRIEDAWFEGQQRAAQRLKGLV